MKLLYSNLWVPFIRNTFTFINWIYFHHVASYIYVDTVSQGHIYFILHISHRLCSFWLKLASISTDKDENKDLKIASPFCTHGLNTSCYNGGKNHSCLNYCCSLIPPSRKMCYYPSLGGRLQSVVCSLEKIEGILVVKNQTWPLLPSPIRTSELCPLPPPSVIWQVNVPSFSSVKWSMMNSMIPVGTSWPILLGCRKI